MATQRPRDQLTRWLDHLDAHLPHLSRPQRRSLALWSYAATVTEHTGLTTCVAFLAETTLTSWRVGLDEPWLLMTDLPPKRCETAFYGLRCWIEQGFRCAKSAGLRCERLRVTDPARAERIWLVLAVSLLWTHACGRTRSASNRRPSSGW